MRKEMRFIQPNHEDDYAYLHGIGEKGVSSSNIKDTL
jgi:hypothetical protein